MNLKIEEVKVNSINLLKDELERVLSQRIIQKYGDYPLQHNVELWTDLLENREPKLESDFVKTLNSEDFEDVSVDEKNDILNSYKRKINNLIINYAKIMFEDLLL